MSHVHTGHGPDNTLDCEGCEDEYWAEYVASMKRSEAEARRVIARNLTTAELRVAIIAVRTHAEMWEAHPRSRHDAQERAALLRSTEAKMQRQIEATKKEQA